MKRALALASILLALTAACGDGGDEDEPSPMAETHEECTDKAEAVLEESEMTEEYATEDFFSLADDGHTLQIGNAPGGTSMTALLTVPLAGCVLEELDAPSSVSAKMEQTRALDGTQTDDWDEYEISWTYHPDDGYSVIVTTD